ncbi:hypothetical protein K488DRAFT_87452 [Vararia minispora EC-137]|uniref:Uncharacterized protein n=1 Tax=Vararia minispora EC-137 TaxID=1314806 RepID=A0ACB8QHI9_9AGAM|nr:hypothetical protein K488DRAFT_87452 [Vararia minispora EC-137]
MRHSATSLPLSRISIVTVLFASALVQAAATGARILLRQDICAQIPDGTDVNDVDPEDSGVIPIACPSSTPAAPSNLVDGDGTGGNPLPSSASSPSGISPGAVAGIAVATACAVTLILFLTLLFWRRRRPGASKHANDLRDHFLRRSFDSASTSSAPIQPRVYRANHVQQQHEQIPSPQTDFSHAIHVAHEAPRSSVFIPPTEWDVMPSQRRDMPIQALSTPQTPQDGTIARRASIEGRPTRPSITIPSATPLSVSTLSQDPGAFI